MINLSEKLGEMTFDGLITDIKPAPEVRGGVIRKLSAAATLKRGTDEKVAVYTAGCFDIGKVTVSASYTITEGDKDNLRMRGIVFKAAAAAN